MRRISFHRRIAPWMAVALGIPALLSAQPAGGPSPRALTALACTALPAIPRSVRYEGMTELIGDIVLSCTGGTPPSSGNVIPTVDITLGLNTDVTSRLLGASGVSEALLLLDEPGSQPTAAPGFGPAAPQILCSSPLGAVAGGCVEYARDVPVNGVTVQVAANSYTGAVNPGANVFQGVVSANQVTFHGVPILPPAAGYTRLIRITNVRANAAGLPGGGPGFPSVTASVTASGPVPVNVTNPVQTVGSVQPGLITHVRDAANLGALASGGASLSQCTGSSSPVPAAILQFGETFGTSFVTRVAPTSAYSGQSGTPVQNLPGAIFNSESAFVFPDASNGAVVAGLADFGTRLKASFSNIPAGVRVFVSLTNLASNTSSSNTPAPSGNSTSTYAALIQSESSADVNGVVPLTIATTSANGGATGLAELVVSNGSATAVWEVINANPNTSETFQFGVWQQFTSNGPPPGTVTVNLGFAPTFIANGASSASSSLPVVRFADTSSPANLLSVTACQNSCTYILSGNATYPAGASNGNMVAVAASTNTCAWTASSPVNWITITSGSSGTGNGTVQFSVQANPNSGPRPTTLTIAGQPFAINQAGQTKATSTTTLAASPASAIAGQTVTLTATVTPSNATGPVTFNDGGAAIGTVNVTGGIASLSTAILAAGTRSLTAAYGGDSGFSGSTSVPVTVTVAAAAGKSPTTTGMAAFPNPANTGQPVTLSAIVFPANATGSITFQDGTVNIGTAALANGSAVLATSSLTVGTHTLTASYSGDSNNATSTSAPVSEVINAATTSTSTTLAATSNPVTAGQTVSLLATVSPISATGSVTFKDGSATLGTIPLSNGSATFSTSTLTAGSHPLTASYDGSLAYGTSTSAALTEVVNPPAVVTVTLSASPSPASFAQAVTLSVTVSPSSATGTVTFMDGSTTIGALVTLSNGSASIPSSTLKVGSHSLQASYSGDANNAATKSALVTETVNPATSTTALSVAPTSSSPGQSIAFTATVTPSGATGTVQLKDGSTTLGPPLTLAGGTVTFSTSTLAAGNHTLTASYSGDGNYAASTSSSVFETVGPAPACVTFPAGFVPFSSVASLSQPNSAGDLAVVGSMSLTSFTTYQSLPLPAGPNQQFCGTVLLAPGIPAIAYVPTAGERTGNFSAFAGLLVDPLANGSIFPGGIIPSSRIPGTFAWRIAALLQTSTTTLSLTPAASAPGQSVTLTATVTPSTATGTVTFVEGLTTLGIAPLNAGTATFATSALPAGTHALTASYGGDSKIGASISTAVTETVGLPAAITILSVTPASSTFGQTVTLTAVVSPPSATGSVTFKDGGTVLGTATLNVGTATLTTSTLATGSHLLTASYSGDSKNGASTSSPVTESVGIPAAVTTLSVTPATSTFGQAVTLSAAVSPATATGSVTFLDGSTILGTAALNAGTATLTTSTLPTGSHSLTASYNGDPNNGAGTSKPVTETVGLAAPTTTLSVTPASSTVGQAVTLTATMSPASATGSVTFLDGSTILQTVAINAGVATFTTSTLATGSHLLTAAYSGDSRNGGSTSSPVSETVTKQTSTTVLSSSPTSSSPGLAVTLTARVTPSSATGSVTFLDGQTVLGTATLNGGAAVFTTSTLAAGSHALSASYAGDSRNSASISPTIVETVVSGSPIQIASPAAPATAFVSVAWSQTFKATGGTAPYKWTLPSNNMPDLAMTASGDTAVVSGTPGTPGAYQLTVRVQDSGSQSSTAPLTFTVYALPVVTITVTQPATPADQPAPKLSLAQAYPFALAGTFTLGFAPNAPGLPVGYNDVQFPAGSATFAVAIPANSTTPNPPIPPIQLGSVAGDIIGTLGSLTMAGSTVPFPGPPPSVKITVPALPPIIVPGSVRITNMTASGFQVFLDASSTTRDLSSGAFVFTAATGTQMNGCAPSCTVSFAKEAAAWFASADGVSNGGTTSLTVPFAFSGDTSVIGTVAVTLTNSVGTSAPVSGGK